jgi:hypothetical protein
MRTKLLLGMLAVVVAGPTPPAGADVTVAMQNGRVTVMAQNAQLRQILAEWARVGQTKIVGAEKLSGPPLTLQLQDVPERQALETLLRAASGYMVAPRAMPAAHVSVFDRILILPTSTAPAATAAAGRGGSAPMAPRPAPIQQAPPMQPAEESDAVPLDPEEQTPEVDIQEGQNFDYANPQQMMRQRQQAQPPAGAASPAGASRPGVMMQPPTPAGPAVFPGTATPQMLSPGGPGDGSSNRPGEVAPVTQQPGVGPYGLPAGVQPGSAVGPSIPPDRSKYLNPYQPQPTKPPGG